MTLSVLVLDQAKGVWGAQRCLLRLAPLLRERGVRLTLAGPRSLELHSAWQEAGFEAVHLGLPVDRAIRRSGRPRVTAIGREGGRSLVAVRLIAELIRSGGYDAVWANAHWIHLEAGIAGRICRTPVMLHLHEEALPGLGSRLRAGAVRIADRTVAVSAKVRQGLPRSARRCVTVIPNGVDTEVMSLAAGGRTADLRAGWGIGAEDVLVLAATRLDPTKRIEDLIAAVHAVPDPRVKLVIAGSTTGYPDYERRLRARAATVGAGRITFCGSRDDMASVFRASDLVIHAGVVEGMPLGLLEAQSCGKPVIAYDVAGVAEAVLDGTTGMLVAPLDVASLARALHRLSADPALRAAMGAAGRVHVLAHHRIEVQAQRHMAVLNDMCGLPTTTAA